MWLLQRLYFFVVIFSGYLLNSSAIASNLPFHHISNEEGLLDNQIVAVMQDREGFIWIGTSRGLSKYDGFRFTHFVHSPQNNKSLSDNKIWALHQDSQGFIWIGTETGGLNRLNPENGEIKVFQHNNNDPTGLPHQYVREIRSASDQSIWIGTSGGGIALLDTKTSQFTHFNESTEPAIASNAIRALKSDNKGGLWIGYRYHGLSYLSADRKSIKHWRFDPDNTNSICSDMVQALYLYQQKSLFVGTWDGGLCRFDLKTEQWTQLPFMPEQSAPFENQAAILRILASEDHLWLGTVNHGLAQYSLVDGKVEWFVHNPGEKYSLTDGGIYALTIDSNQNLWVGSWGNGLNVARLSAQQFKKYRHQVSNAASIQQGPVQGIVMDDQQKLWVGVENGGISVKSKKQKGFNRIFDQQINGVDPSNLKITLLYYSRQAPDQLWIGTLFSGLFNYHIKENRWQQWRHHPDDFNSLSDNDVRSIIIDHRGTLWVGTTNGLNRLNADTGHFEHYLPNPDEKSISHHDIYVLFEDSKNRLWVGTNGGGINQYLPATNQFKQFKRETDNTQSISHNTIWDIQEDLEGKIWTATEAALDELVENSDEEPYFAARLQKRFASIEVDRRNRLWLASPTGITLFDTNNKQFSNFDVLDGVLSRHYYRSKWQDDQGFIYFGGNSGITYFDPEQIIVRHNANPLRLVNFRVYGKQVKQLNTLDKNPASQQSSYQLKSDTYGMRLEFSPLDFRFKSELNLRYRLSGLDSRWQQTDVNLVEFNHLQPGDYQLQIKAQNQYDSQTSEVTKVDFFIETPIHRRWWAYLIYITLLLLIALRIFQAYRDKQMLMVMETLSMKDALTGLNNRFFLSKHLPIDLSLCQRKWREHTAKEPVDNGDFLFFIIDLDHFKMVNDTHGHAAGDQVLNVISNVLKQVFRDSDYIIRWGGEEFLVVARETSRNSAAELAERLRDQIEQTNIEISPQLTLNKTCSIGFCAYPLMMDDTNALTWEQTLELADLCLYCAKLTARNAWVGLLSAELNENILSDFKTNPHLLIQSGKLSLVTSIDSKTPLIWTNEQSK